MTAKTDDTNRSDFEYFRVPAAELDVPPLGCLFEPCPAPGDVAHAVREAGNPEQMGVTMTCEDHVALVHEAVADLIEANLDEWEVMIE